MKKHVYCLLAISSTMELLVPPFSYGADKYAPINADLLVKRNGISQQILIAKNEEERMPPHAVAPGRPPAAAMPAQRPPAMQEQRGMQQQQQVQQRAMQQQQQMQQRAVQQQQQGQQRAQQEQQREQQRAQQQQMEGQQRAQQQEQKLEQVQQRQQGEQQRAQQQEQRREQVGEQRGRPEFGGQPGVQPGGQPGNSFERDNRAGRATEPGRTAEAGGGHQFGATPRPNVPPPLNTQAVPYHKAFHEAHLVANASPEQQKQAQTFTRNFEQHIHAVPANQGPQNIEEIRHEQFAQYTHNYQTMINNQPVTINPQNTYINPSPASLPSWYQPTPGWNFSNGFVLGSAINVGPSWLNWGWPSCYGPAPSGFNCQQGYMPTPWMYCPYNNTWREAGVFGVGEGPGYGYTGPISVQVIEPVEIEAMNPYTGGPMEQVVNEMFIYNAFYYPQFGRWGYTNRQGYFVWLNTQPWQD